VRRIAAAAGVSIGLINHHFPSIDELIAEAYRHFSRELVHSLESALNTAAETPRARLHAFLKASFSPPTLDPDLLNVWIVFWGLHRHSQDIQRVHAEVYGIYLELVRRLLADAAKESGKGRFNSRLTAIGLVAMLDGLWLEWCLDPDNFQPKEAVALCESWIDHVCEPRD
jgi:TetR/AcrR family transcriptional repressor of bet genes